MLTGIIVSYNGKQGQIRTNTGIRYAFAAKHVKAPGAWQPVVNEAVIVKLQNGQPSTVRSVRQLPPGYLKSINPYRMIPARYVGWGIAVSRFAPAIEVSSQLRFQHGIGAGSLVMVRYELKGNMLATATAVSLVPKNSAQQQLLAALLASKPEVESGTQALQRQLEALTEVGADEQFQHLKELLQQWDAYTTELPVLPVPLQETGHSRLAAEGYAHCLSEEARLRLVSEATDLAPLRGILCQLPAGALNRLAMERVAGLSAETSLRDYQLLGHWVRNVQEVVELDQLLQPPALSQLPLPDAARVYWWELGLVSEPPHSLLAAELARRLQVAQTNPKSGVLLQRLIATCRRHNYLAQIGQQMLEAIPVAERLAKVRVLTPLVDDTMGAKWTEDFLIGQLAEEELYESWEKKQLPWLPAELVARQLLSRPSGMPEAAMLRLATMPGAITALVQARKLAGPWQAEQARALGTVLQVLHKAASPPPPVYWNAPKPVSGLPMAWAKEALLALRNSITDLPGTTWVTWWLEDLLPEPPTAILLANCLGEEGNQQEAGWKKLSANGISAVLEPLIAWVMQAQPLEWVIRTQKIWSKQLQFAPLMLQTAAAIEASWPATTQVEMWLLDGGDRSSFPTPQNMIYWAALSSERTYEGPLTLLDQKLEQSCRAVLAGESVTTGLDNSIDLQAFAAEKEWCLVTAEKAIYLRTDEALKYLPTASMHFFEVAVNLFCKKKFTAREIASVRVPLLVVFARVVIERFNQDTDLILPWLGSVMQQCIAAAGSKPSKPTLASTIAGAEGLIVRWVEQKVSNHLTAGQCLKWWASGLITTHPAVSQAELVEFAVHDMQLESVARVAAAYALPAVIVSGWKELGNLRGAQFDQLYPSVKELLLKAYCYPDLLTAVDPYLDAELTTTQRGSLWLFGYPGEQPTQSVQWSIPERMEGVICIRSMQRDLTAIPWLAPTAEEIDEWLTEQYWDENADLAIAAFNLLLSYHSLALVELPAWGELEAELLLRCASLVKVRLWMSLPPSSQQHLFNYYAFRRGYSRLGAAEQREFLRMGKRYLLQAEKTEQEFKSALHLRRRRLLRWQDGVAVYRMSLAHCYCPQEGYLEVELADKCHTIPCPYPEATLEWNARFLQMPWAACPVLVHVDEQTRELVKIQGLEAALQQFPTDQQPRAHYSFQRERKAQGTTDNPAAYWEDEQLHDELSSYLLELAEAAPFPAIVLTEKPVSRARPLAPDRSRPKPKEESIGEKIAGEEEDELVLGRVVLPQQMKLSRIVDQQDVVFVWTPQFPHSNRATYVFRAPLIHHEQALGRLEYLLHNVGGIRSALLAPGPTSHRLRCHLGYVRTIRGKRGQAQAFEGWRKRLDGIIATGPERQHAYDPDSQFVPWELENPVVPAAPTAAAPPELPATEPVLAEPILPDSQPAPPQIRAQQLLQKLQRFNSLFLAGYSS